QVKGSGDGGYVSLQTGSLALTGGGKIESSSAAGTSGNLGMIQVAASGAIDISGSDAQGNASGIYGQVNGIGNGGLIEIGAASLSVSQNGTIDAGTFSSGSGGIIQITTSGTTSLTSGATLYSDTQASGAGGNILLGANSLQIDGASIIASVSASGDGGIIQITASSLNMTHGGQIDVSSSNGSTGNLGSILVTAKNSVSLSGTDSSGNSSGIYGQVQGYGDGGLISIQSASLNLDHNATIDAGTFSSGNGGSIYLNVSGAVSLSSGATLYSDTQGNGAGGNIVIDARSVAMDGASILASANGAGPGGFIQVAADTLSLSSGAQINAGTTDSGYGGLIDVKALQSVSLSGGSSITSKSTGSGFAGDISLDAGLNLLLDSSSITTGASIADGGNMQIIAKSIIRLQGSQITSTVGNGFGNGGNISIDPLFVVLNGSTITANAFGGNGGNINLVSNNFFQSGNSYITASSRLGVSGTVTVTSQFTDLNGSLVSLPMVYLDALGLLRQRCAAQIEGHISTFVLSGRGGLPFSPDDPMPSSIGNAPAAARMHLASTEFGCSN
ncbi:MAG: hypothetical protein HKL98_03095, partial [Burkholderiales bacterium]|nr:hypothetical protein [Burkholderiales bacterium]